MAFGLFFDNDSLRRQLDADTPTMSLVSKGTGVATQAVTTGGGNQSRAMLLTLTFTGRTAPMLAVGVDKPAQGEKLVQVVSSSLSGQTWTFKIIVWHDYGTDYSVRWYLFDVPYNVTPSGFGFAFWDAQQRLTAYSSLAPMRTVSAMVSGRLYAAVHISGLIVTENWWWDTTAQVERVDWQYYMDGISTYPGASYVSGFIEGGTSFNTPSMPYPSNPNSGARVSIMVDVTGL